MNRPPTDPKKSISKSISKSILKSIFSPKNEYPKY
jgi:hypothetical protein